MPSRHVTSADLRAIADALDAFSHTTATTGVSIEHYIGAHVTVLPSDIRLELTWVPTTEDQPGHYTVLLEET